MTSDVFDVRERVIVITGGLGLLGYQFTCALLERGARVAVLDVQADAQNVERRFGEKARAQNVLFVTADVTKQASLRAALELIRDTWETPFGLVNNAALDSTPNAAVEENGPFETFPESAFDRMMEVNVKGVFQCCQVFGGAMAQHGRGSIINISSTYGLVSPDQRLYEYRRKEGELYFKPVTYSVSKSALLNMTRYLATYWAPRNVRVNTLTFGGVGNRQDERFVENYNARVPLGRMARPDEYNGALVFLLSEASSYMTGSNLVIDGGWTAW